MIATTTAWADWLGCGAIVAALVAAAKPWRWRRPPLNQHRRSMEALGRASRDPRPSRR